MSRLLQAGLATVLAASAHVALFAALPGAEGAAATQAAGEEGLAEISLAPVPEALESLIAAWETPPEAAAEPVAPTPALPDLAPEMPAPAPEAPAAALPEAPLAPPVEATPAAVAPPEPPKKAPEKPPEEPVAKPEPSKPTATPEKAVVEKDEAPAKKPAKQSNPAPGQKAKGKGKGTVAGKGGSDQANAPSAGQVKKLQTEWGAKIRSRIAKALKRPAKQTGGTVVLSIVVGPDGALRSARITQSSGNAGQDQAALAAVKSAGRFPKAPAGVPETSIKVKLKFDK